MTTRIATFFVRGSRPKPSFATVTEWRVDPIYVPGSKSQKTGNGHPTFNMESLYWVFKPYYWVYKPYYPTIGFTNPTIGYINPILLGT